MVQFNLLPDVKLEFLKAERRKQIIRAVSIVVIVVSLGLTSLLFFVVNVVQKGHLNNLSADIKRDINKLKGEDDFDKVLTVQNQLNSLTSLHEQKPELSRLFDYLAQVTPTEISISTLSLDMETKKISITGQAPNVAEVNKFVDTLKFTKFVATDDLEEEIEGVDIVSENAFSEVVLSSFGINKEGSQYTIDFAFREEIFNDNKQVTLIVPSTITTRSETEKPLFKEQVKEEQNSGGQ